MSAPKTLVTGATGYIGRLLAAELIARGTEVRCLVRNPARLEDSIARAADVAVGDVLEPESLAPALEGIEAAYYLVHSMGAGEDKFVELDKRGAENFGSAAARAGVRRIVYLGGLGSEQDRLSPHLASRQQTGRRLAGAGVPVTEFRAGSIIGSGSLAFDILRYLAERIPMMVLPKWVKNRTQPIALSDVLRYLVECLDRPDTAGRVLEIGGADVLTYEQMMSTYAQLRGLHRLFLNVPLLTPRLSSLWVGLVTPLPFAVARALITGTKNELFCRDESAREIFAFETMGFAEAVERALAEPRERILDSDRVSTYLSRKTRPRSGLEIYHAEGMIIEKRRAETSARPAALFSILERIAERGWPYADRLWRLRMLIDRLLGGRAGRRRGGGLRQGGKIDFWRIDKVEGNRLLRLCNADMRLPGRVWLQFRISEAKNGRTVVSQEMYYEPRGLAGVLYWYALYPLHSIVFSGTLKAIIRQAEGMGEGS